MSKKNKAAASGKVVATHISGVSGTGFSSFTGDGGSRFFSRLMDHDDVTLDLTFDPIVVRELMASFEQVLDDLKEVTTSRSRR